jgi:hypothetical protein
MDAAVEAARIQSVKMFLDFVHCLYFGKITIFGRWILFNLQLKRKKEKP